MARFDVYRLGGGLVLDCQADLLQVFDRRFVVPLLSPADVPSPTKRLHPQFDVQAQPYIMATHMAASVPTHLLGRRVATLWHEQDAIMNALDMLVSGY
ncbi:CcdB family protein [Sphingobium yanoikuyae]|jgi:toxin CcdB|uniref:CcdB family protein n=1 Tax=Sphingobium yanoikuyae TaxID=13690 RepID=UPI002FDCFAB2